MIEQLIGTFAVLLRHILLVGLLLLLAVGCSDDPTPFERFESENVALTKLPRRQGDLKFLVLGDWGRRGRYFQDEVAETMGKVAGEINADFIVTTGDNFYPSGVASVWDSHWQQSFEYVYTAPSLDIPWYATLGNHDHRGTVQAQIDYTEHSDRWNMPGRYYAITQTLDDTTRIQFIFLDTVALYLLRNEVEGVEIPDSEGRRQLGWLDSTLTASTADWRIVAGHHPLYSAGDHGGSRTMQRLLEPIFQKHGVQMYFAGHDHDLQHLRVGEIDYFVSGGGSALRATGTSENALFAMTRPGFLVMSIAEEQALAQFVDHQGHILYGSVIERSLPAADSLAVPLPIPEAAPAAAVGALQP